MDFKEQANARYEELRKEKSDIAKDIKNRKAEIDKEFKKKKALINAELSSLHKYLVVIGVRKNKSRIKKQS